MIYKVLISSVVTILFQFFIQDCTGESTFDIDLSMKSKKNPIPNNLTCFVCHSEKQRDCQNLTSFPSKEIFSTPCDTNMTFCMVKRISFSTSANTSQPIMLQTVAVKRNCTPKCDPGCVIMGERTRLYVCSTCCQKDNCNDGNGASQNSPKDLLYLLNIPIVMFNCIVFLTTCRPNTS